MRRAIVPRATARPVTSHRARGRTRARCARVHAASRADAPARALDFNAVARSHVAGYGASPIASRLTREFGFGDAGSDVACVQRLLGLAGDGRCDAATSDALRSWQGSRGLIPSGFFGQASMAQVAREEAAWRELGGDAVLARLAEERDAALRAESGERASAVSATAVRAVKPSAPVWSAAVHSSAAHSSILIAAVGLAGAAAWAVKRRDVVDAALVRASSSAASARELAGRFRLSIVAGWTAIATMARRATTTVDEPSGAAVESVANEAPVIEDTERAASRPSVNFTNTTKVQSSSLRAEEMRERWVNIRRGPVDAADADVRREDAEIIERVSDFLGGEDDVQT